METQLYFFTLMGRLSSYRTYEEWKLNIINFINLYKTSSYRTYEEWKPGLSFEYVSYNSSSYRTYEEWKREIAEKQEEIDKVLTVPMRNGNYSGSSMSNNSSSVLTVPMRNGNRYQLQMPTIVGKFLPYL